jgi:hypothetical protein
MSMLQPISVVSAAPPQTEFSQTFTYGTDWPYNADIDAEDCTSYFTLHNPAIEPRHLYFESTTNRLQLDAANVTSGSFSWDEPGLTSGPFRYRLMFTGTAVSANIMLYFGWTPDPTKAHQGDGYRFHWNPQTKAVILEVIVAGVTSSVASTTKTGSSYDHYMEVEVDPSGGTVDAYIWRTIDSKPSTPTLSASSLSIDDGKVGIRIYGPNGHWIDSLYIDKAWEP